MSRQVTHDGRGMLIVTFGFDRRLVDLVKSLPNRRWNGERKVWSVPEADILALVEVLHPEGFGFDAVVVRLYGEAGGRRVAAIQVATAEPRGGDGLAVSSSNGPALSLSNGPRGLFDPEPEPATGPESP